MLESMKKEELDTIGENVDGLVTIDFSGRGTIKKLYAEARRIYQRPITLLAAEKLVERIKPDDVVFLVNGLIIPPYGAGENDGPLGSAVLARAMQIGLGARSVLMTDDVLADMVAATCRGANLNVIGLERLMESPRAVAVKGYPIDNKKTENQKLARDIIDTLKPKALVAIERRGPNTKGVYHTSKGFDMSNVTAKAFGYMFEEARNRGILTIGIGDCGNEIGMGVIGDVVKKINPYGAVCQCPCKSGMADATMVDIAIPASVSNWGAYGIAACLSFMLGKPDVLHTKEVERRMLRECIDAGGIDGISHYPEPSVDAMPGEIHADLVEMLGEIVRVRAKAWAKSTRGAFK